MKQLVFVIIVCSIISCKNEKLFKLQHKEVSASTIAPQQIELGTGYNTVTQIYRAQDVVQSERVSSDSPGTGQNIHLQISYVQSINDLRSTTEVGGGASIGIGVFSLGAKAQWVNSVATSSSSSYLVISSKVISFSKKMIKPVMNPDFVPANAGGINHFLDVAGDEFVDELDYGGELYIVFKADAYSKAEQKNNSEKFNIAVKAFNIGGNRSEGHDALEKIDRMTVYMYRTGGENYTFQHPDTTTIDKLLSYATSFPDSVKKSYTLMGVHTSQYSTLRDFPYTVSYQNILLQKWFFEDVAGRVQKLQDLQSELNFTLADRNHQIFDSKVYDSARAVSDTINGRVDKLKRCVETCQFQFSVANCSIQSCPYINMPIPNYEISLPATYPRTP